MSDLPRDAVFRIGSPNFYAGFGIGYITLSPDNTRLVALGNIMRARVAVFDLPSGRPVVAKEIRRSANSYACAGNVIATVSPHPDGGDKLDLYDAPTLEHRGTFWQDSHQRIELCELSEDGALLLIAVMAAKENFGFDVWSIAEKRILHRISEKLPRSIDGRMTTREYAFFRDEDTEQWYAYSLKTGKLVKELGECDALCASTRGEVGVVRGSTLSLFNFSSSSEKSIDLPLSDKSTNAFLSFDSTLLAVTTTKPGYEQLLLPDKCDAHVIDLETGKVLWSRHFPIELTSPWFDGDGKTLYGVTGSRVRAFDARTGEDLCPRTGHDGVIRSLQYTPDGALLLSRATDNTLRVWSAIDGKPVASHALPAGATCEALSPDGRVIAVGFEDGMVRLLEVATGREVSTFKREKDVWGLAFSIDATTLFASGNGTSISQWDLETGKEFKSIKTSKTTTVHLFPLSGGARLATATEFSGKVIDLGTRKPLTSFRAPTGGEPLDDACLLDDQRLAAYWGWPSKTAVFDLATGEQAALFKVKIGASRIAAHAGRKLLAVCGKLGNIRVLDSETGRPLAQFDGAFIDSITAVAFSPDGSRLAAACDGDIIVWDTARIDREAPADPISALLFDAELLALRDDGAWYGKHGKGSVLILLHDGKDVSRVASVKVQRHETLFAPSISADRSTLAFVLEVRQAEDTDEESGEWHGRYDFVTLDLTAKKAEPQRIFSIESGDLSIHDAIITRDGKRIVYSQEVVSDPGMLYVRELKPRAKTRTLEQGIFQAPSGLHWIDAVTLGCFERSDIEDPDPPANPAAPLAERLQTRKRRTIDIDKDRWMEPHKKLST